MIGMTAAIAQGVVANTIDVDLWINLPSRPYMRLLNLSRKLDATIAANTVVYLRDGTPVNFVLRWQIEMMPLNETSTKPTESGGGFTRIYD